MELPGVRLLGVQVHAVTQVDLTRLIRASVSARRRFVIGHHNLNGLALMRRNPEMRAYYETCDVAYADGMAVIIIARLFGGPFARRHRLTSLDFFDEILAQAASDGWRVFYLGSAPDVIDAAARIFRSRHPGLHVAVRNGFFDATSGSDENKRVIEEINRFSPDLLVVGMGMPRQEAWAHRNQKALNASVIFPIGALADYVAGVIPTPPRWAGRLGLEWLFRLVAEPRRLGRRYLIDPWTLILPLLVDRVRRRGRRLRS